MCKFNPKNNGRRIDPCIKNLIDRMNLIFKILNKHGEINFKIVGCCCGHFRYPMTLIVESKDKDVGLIYHDFISGVEIPRKKKFYVRDKQGIYYIPEVQDLTRKTRNADE